LFAGCLTYICRMFKSVRLWVAAFVLLIIGGAAGWAFSPDTSSNETSTPESWLFSHTAESGEIRELADGSLELVLRSIDEHVTAFSDRPYREAKIESVEWLVSTWDELFAGSPPNAVLVEHQPDGVAKSVVVELNSPRLTDGELIYSVEVLESEPDGRLTQLVGLSHDDPVRQFETVSLFIDNVTLSCANGGTCAVGDTGPGGGIIIWVGKPGAYAEVATEDVSGTFNWADADLKARDYRGGKKSDWRLPKYSFLQDIYSQKSTIPGLTGGTYWSGEDGVGGSKSARALTMSNNVGTNASKTELLLVRPVREVPAPRE